MKIYVDIDDTICYYNNNELKTNYNNAKPYHDRIKKINKLYTNEDYIVYWTARGTVTKIDWYDITKKQLEKWGCKYHELIMGKPAYDLFIDDKNINSETYFKSDKYFDLIQDTNIDLNNLKILCVIPARSGSKGIPDKNIKLFKGKPLISWSIEQAKKSKYNMRIIVSTDSEDYANISKQYGAECPFIRPKNISKDNSTDYELFNHCIDWLASNEKYEPDIILQLRPTQPCRKVDDIDKCLNIFLKNLEEYDSLRTVVEIEKSPFKMYTIDDENQMLKPLFRKIEGITEPYNQGRQFLPKSYLHNGYIDIFKSTIIKYRTISGNNIYPYVMNKNDTIDIDTLDDWKKAEENFN